MMTYFLDDTHLDSVDLHTPVRTSFTRGTRSNEREDVHLLNEKLRIPRFRGLVKRPRLDDLLTKAITQFPATLISGRAGTGKTSLAAAFARRQQHVAWYSVESSDIEWNVFSSYFATCVLRAVNSRLDLREVVPAEAEPSQAAMATFLINVFAEAETDLIHEPLLIVLDGIHHLFDAPWFGEFFTLLLSSLPETASLLLLCRSKPPSPLWRMRSKQQLNVIDEKVLAFDLAETVQIARKNGLPRSDAERIHTQTFGRVSKLLETIAERKPLRTRR